MDETVVDIAFVLSGFALLMFGGEALVQGATRISQILAYPPGSGIHSRSNWNITTRTGCCD